MDDQELHVVCSTGDFVATLNADRVVCLCRLKLLIIYIGLESFPSDASAPVYCCFAVIIVPGRRGERSLNDTSHALVFFAL